MPRKSKEFLKRSRAAKLGWQRKRNYERLHKLYKQHHPKKHREITPPPPPSEITPPPPPSEITPPPPPSEIMWRVTVSAPYYRRGTGRKKRGSIASSYMVRGWYKTKKQAQKALSKLSDRAIEGRFDVLETNHKAWWNGQDDLVNTEIRNVPYDARFLDTIEEQNEELHN